MIWCGSGGKGESERGLDSSVASSEPELLLLFRYAIIIALRIIMIRMRDVRYSRLEDPDSLKLFNF